VLKLHWEFYWIAREIVVQPAPRRIPPIHNAAQDVDGIVRKKLVGVNAAGFCDSSPQRNRYSRRKGTLDAKLAKEIRVGQSLSVQQKFLPACPYSIGAAKANSKYAL
jgi:hypothetical protein